MMRFLSRWINITLCLLILAIAACSDSSEPDVTPLRVVELATVAATDPDTHLEVWNRQNQSITLTSPQLITGAETGMRLLVSYEAAVADTILRPIPIKILGVAAIPYGEVTPLSEHEISQYSPLQYEILSQWQTGPWLNFQLKAKLGSQTQFILAADERTLSSDVIECYFLATNPPEGNAYINRRTYASYRISDIITHPRQTIKLIPPRK